MAEQTIGSGLSINPATPQKLTNWSNEPSLLVLKQDVEASKPFHDNHVQNVQRWTDLLKIRGKSKPEKRKGRSSVQPKLIRRQAEWRYSALTEPFLGTEKLFEVSPATHADGPSAKQNELVLNWQFRTKLDKVAFVDEFVRTNVDEGSCLVRVGWKRVTQMVEEDAPVYEYLEILDQNEMDMFTQMLQAAEADPDTFESEAPDEVKEAINYYKETGQPNTAVVVDYKKVKVEKVLDNKPTLDVMNIENVFIDPSCGNDLTKANFIAVSFETSKADLLKDKDRYKNLNLVNWETSTPVTNTDHSTNLPQTFNFRDTLRKRVVAIEYWGFYDIKGNNTLVPIVATWIGDTMIRMEENPFPDKKLPFVLSRYMPLKRELMGEPDAEILEDNQAILGAVTRGMIDLMGRSANGQQGMAKGMLDVLNRRRYESGQDYEFNPNMPPNLGLIEHKYPEIPNSAITMLTLQNQEAEALTGVKSFSGGMSGEAYGDVAAGIRGVLDASAKREMAILRRLAKAMTDIGNKIIAMNGAFLSKEEVIQVTDEEFITITREELLGNFNLKVDISTAEIDNNKAQDLGFMLQTMGPTMPPEFSQMILADIARLKRMPVLAKQIETYKPQPDPLAQKLQELEVMVKEAEYQKLQSEIELNKAKTLETREKADALNLNTIEEETGTKHERGLEMARAQATGNQNLEVTKALLKPRKQANGQETKPEVEAAVGFNQLTKARDQEPAFGPRNGDAPNMNPSGL